MKKLDTLSTLSGTFNNIATAITTITTTFGISFYFFKDYIFEIISLIEFVIIIFLIFKNKNTENIISPITKNIANEELFIEFFNEELKTSTKNLTQLNLGYLDIFSEEVKNIQTKTVSYVLKTNKNFIDTLDLTSDPKRWLTRVDYIDANKKFIENGGTIRRVLIINEKNLINKEFVDNLIKLISTLKRIGVQTGLHFECFLKPNQLIDFIIYGNFSVLVEGKQADEDYKIASSTMKFLNTDLKLYNEIFLSVWNKNTNFPNTMEILNIFVEYYENSYQKIYEEYSKNDNTDKNYIINDFEKLIKGN